MIGALRLSLFASSLISFVFESRADLTPGLAASGRVDLQPARLKWMVISD
jgi:hypothetical protein